MTEALELKGKFDTAKVFTFNIDQVTIAQVIEFLNQPFAQNAHTRIMSDCHAGKGAVIGTTMHVKDKIVPNLVGVDIGCGIRCIEIKPTDINFEKLDNVIRAKVPFGRATRDKIHPYIQNINLTDIYALNDEKNNVAGTLTSKAFNTALLSLGSLGNGNHFIEMNQSEDGRLFLVIHSGSRSLGVKVATYHQNKAIKRLSHNKEDLQQMIAGMKTQNQHQHIEAAIKNFHSLEPKMPKELMYLEGDDMEMYLSDLKITQSYAAWNRTVMANEIIKGMGFETIGAMDTIHNYVDLDDMILRKGAISARKGEQVLIPINMRDGSILATGKGNEDWNKSAPHGAGRILSRSQAKKVLSIEDFEETMNGVFSTSISPQTLDESPFAYKPMDEIIANTQDTITVNEILRPIYNFKATE